MNPQYYSIDDELERYEQAARFKGAAIPDTPSMADAVTFNAAKNVEEVYTKMPNGGHVKISERSITDEASLKRYDTALRDAGVTPSVEDYYAFGADDDLIAKAGLSPQAPMGGRTEPLSDFEKLYVERQGGELFETQSPTMREDVVDLTYMNSEGDLRKVFSALGIDEFTARQIAEGIWGNPESSRGDLGMGAADFLPTGLLFGAQEGMRTYQRGISSGDYLTAGAGALEAGLSFLEALPLTAAGAKGLKKQIPVFRNALAELGQQAQSRIDAEGTTLFSNPVGPIVDRGLAAAGRFLGAPRARSVDEFAELAASGKLRQARTTEQDISDITEKKMPATVINLQGAGDELSIAYESGEITDQLTQAGLFVDDDKMGTIYVGTTQENLDAIKSAENPAEIGKLSGYSDADIAAFYLKRRGGDKKAAFQEYRSDLADARAKERDQVRQRSREQNEAPDTSYRMEHQPRGPEDGEGIRLDDLTKNISGEQAGYPDDFYTSQGMRIYAQGPSFEGDEYGLANQESYEIIASVKGNPDAEVTIYRAVPDEDAITTINPGDFVTLSPTYAKLHGASGYGRSGDEAGKVLEQKVKVRDIYWDGNDVNEFGYFPEEE
jgi:hypothetical protein